MLSRKLIKPIITKRGLYNRGPSFGCWRSFMNGARTKIEEDISSSSSSGSSSGSSNSSYLRTFMLLSSIFGGSSAIATQSNLFGSNQTSSLESIPENKSNTTDDNDDNDNNDNNDDNDVGVGVGVGVDEAETTTVINWSGTHTIEVPTKHYYEPESIDELQAIVSKCHSQNINIRPVGSALSPNAISFQTKGMISLSNLDEIINIDTEQRTVTVQAGARVSQVIDALRPYGLTLPNLASIAEQQMGGFVQIGAHGTGANIPPVDEFVRSITLVTPAHGTVTLSKDDDKDGDNDMFHLAKVGLGCLGVVSEITMDCIPSHRLLEHTYVITRKEARDNINDLLKKHKHIRYMWIPYEDAVVVVTNDPEDEYSEQTLLQEKQDGGTSEDKMKPLKDLLKQLSKDKSGMSLNDETINEKGFGELRDALLAFDPLNGEHIKLVNKAEADFWKQNEGYQLKPSDELLQFDCGGQQWVFEVCFPTGSYEVNNGNDIKFMEELLEKIESENIPAPAPIEQRWSASSSSSMSPAHGPEGGLHCWVGIIMYLPSDDPNERKEITNRFRGQYCDLAREVGMPYNVVSHWGKLEMPTNGTNFLQLRELMSTRYPLSKFNALRMFYDPKNLLANDLLNTVLGTPK